MASQPTRGLDVGSIEFVHKQIVAERDGGVAVVIVSSELDEIYALSDRIAVMYEGKIVGFCAPDIPEYELGLMMTGAGAAEAHGQAAAADSSELGDTTAAHSASADEALELPGGVSTTKTTREDSLPSPGQPGSQAQHQEPEQ